MKDQETDAEAERQPLVSHYFFHFDITCFQKVQLQLTA